MEIGEFHNRNGWFFKRTADGSVRIQKRTPDAASTVELSHEIPPNEWASIIAHVTAHGETAESYDAAQRFHAGRYYRRRAADNLIVGGAAGFEEARARSSEGGIAQVASENAADLRDLQRRLP